jgi:hypothetical protein
MATKKAQVFLLLLAKVLGQEDSNLVDLILQGIGKNYFLHFKCYNLVIYAANLFGNNTTHNLIV